MAVSTTCSGLRIEQSGRILIDFDDGSELTFDTMEQAQAHCAMIDAPSQEEFAQKLLLRDFFLNSPDGMNAGAIVGHTVTFDMTQAVRIAFS